MRDAFLRIVLLLRPLVFTDDVILCIIKSDTFRLFDNILLDSREGFFWYLSSPHRLLFQSDLNIDIFRLFISWRVMNTSMQELDIPRAIRMLPWTGLVHRGPARGTFLPLRSSSFSEGDFLYLCCNGTLRSVIKNIFLGQIWISPRSSSSK